MLIIETVINRYLALDPEIQAKLAAFNGKVVKLELLGSGRGVQRPNEPSQDSLNQAGLNKEGLNKEGLNKSEQNQKNIITQLYIFPTDSGIQISKEFDGLVDTVLRGSPIALFKMGLLKNTASLLLKGEVEISGDTRLGHQFKAVFSQMDIDWSEPMAEVVGDELAYQLLQSGSQFIKWGKASVRSLSMSVSEYLQEESRDVVTDTELDIFNNKVDRLRDDVERLQARVNLLSK